MESEGQYQDSPPNDESQLAGKTRVPKLRNQYYATFIICVCAFSLGAASGWASPMILILGSDDSPVGKMTNLEISPLETLPAIAALIGAALFAAILTKFGRKVTGYLGSTCSIIGGLLLLTATYKVELYIGRMMTGVGAIALGLAAPIYLSEIAHPSIRGTLMTLCSFASQCGFLVSFLLGIVCGYRVFTAITLVGAVIFPILFFWLPESPQYLLLQSRTSEAHDALLWYRGDSRMVEEELQSISKVTPKKVNCCVILKNRVNQKVTIIFLFLYIFNIMSGANVVMGYASQIFHESDNALSPNVSAAILAIIKLCASFVSVFLIDRTGRRFLVIFSYFVMSIALVVTTVYFYLLKVGSAVDNQGWIPIVSLSTYIGAFTMGVGSASEVIVTELLTPEIKAVALGILGIMSTLFTFVSLQLYAVFVEYVGLYFNFLVEAVFSITAIFIAWFILPETKGKSIAETVELLSDGKPVFHDQRQETMTENDCNSQDSGP